MYKILFFNLKLAKNINKLFLINKNNYLTDIIFNYSYIGNYLDFLLVYKDFTHLYTIYFHKLLYSNNF